MPNFIKKIAAMLTEDPDIFSDYQEQFRKNTILDEEIYGDIVGILKDVAENNGLTLDPSTLKIKFNPAGFTIKNIHLDCSDAHAKRILINRVAEITGDDNIKNTFNKNLRVNFYTAINKEFANRVREELNLEITHQSNDLLGAEDSSNVLPMATFTQPAVTAEKPEETMVEPELAQEPAPELEPAPAPEGEEEIEAGPYGLEAPGGKAPEGEEEAPEEAPEAPEETPIEGEEEAPAEGEEEDMIEFESIKRIAAVLTDDPNIKF